MSIICLASSGLKILPDPNTGTLFNCFYGFHVNIARVALILGAPVNEYRACAVSLAFFRDLFDM
jgi:hypothetical protein